MLNLDSYQLLGAAPELRSKFIDWMVFHVEPSFFKNWQDYAKILRQRNAVLKGFGQKEHLGYWTEKLSETGEILHALREKTLAQWKNATFSMLAGSPGVDKLELGYEAGWNTEYPLIDHLHDHIQHALELGYTSSGPHRADLKIMLGQQLARHVLSTGQQKRFVSMLQLAQSRWVSEQNHTQPIILVDDLPS